MIVQLKMYVCDRNHIVVLYRLTSQVAHSYNDICAQRAGPRYVIDSESVNDMHQYPTDIDIFF